MSPNARINKEAAEGLTRVGERTTRNALKRLVEAGVLDEQGSTSNKTWGLA